MTERAPESLQRQIEERLRYYEDLGIRLFYRDRQTPTAAAASFAPAVSNSIPTSALQESFLPKPIAKPAPPKAAAVAPIVAPSAASLFESVDKIKDDTLLKIREDIGDCTRCKLHKGRNKIVFGDGNPKAELVFIGEGPGADEDAQGLPFVGRAGKLLTQMIEAMGLQRRDVYICNVVKCRPPENRAPEPDEVTTCSPYLLRQIDVIKPKVIVCLGAVAAKTLLETTARDFAIPRTVAGMARPQAHGHLPSCLSTAQSQRQGRSVERPAKSDGGIGFAAAKEIKIVIA